MKKNKIVWITFNAFLDTDLYIVKELASVYEIEWHIIRSENDRFEYIQEIEVIQNTTDIKVSLHVCGKRLRKLECALYYVKILNMIKNESPDMVYSSLAGAPYFLPIFAHKTNTNKTVLAIHNVHVPKGGTAYYFFKAYNQYAFKHFKHFQTFSVSQCDALKNIIPQKDISYVPFMLKDYGEAKKSRTSDKLTFLNFGNIRAYKRIDVLIEAAQKVYENTGSCFRVIIAGKCENWEEYQSKIKYDFLFDVRLGRVENDDIADLFNECDYFVAPYQDIAQSGSAVVAVNYGKPIIASRLPAFEEYIENEKTGFLIRPANEQDLVDVMTKIVKTSKTDYDIMVKELEDSRKRYFSTSAIIEKYKEYFDDVISNG